MCMSCKMAEATEELATEDSDSTVQTFQLSASADFFPEDHIPPLSIQRTTAEEITRFFEHHRCPDLPTDFD